MKLFTIGCSFTEGQGLKRQSFECYPHLLAEKLELEYFNFGAAGMSNDYIFRKVFELINSDTLTKNDILIIQWTHYLRKELPVSYNEYKWYHVVPNSFHAYDDKIIVERHNTLSVQNMYVAEELTKKFINNKTELQSTNKSLLENYMLHFLNETYQKNTTKNYVNSLYTYLEHFGYKHIHFFGWDKCVIESIYSDGENFLKESFGGYTKTKGNDHPNKKGHALWSDFLYEKIKELKYDNIFEIQLKNYRNNLHKLKMEIEKDIEYTNDKIVKETKIQLERQIEIIKKEKEIELEKQMKLDVMRIESSLQKTKIDLENKMEKIRKQKEQNLQNQIKEDTERLEALKEEIKIEIQKEQERLNSIKKTKTLI